MKLIQALRKLGKSSLKGFDTATLTWVEIDTVALLESDQRWISERVGFNARRVLLTEKTINPYRVLKVADDDIRRIVYSEQRAVHATSAFLYDYTVLDETHEARLVTIATVPAASGMGGEKTETLSDPFPVHMVRFAGTKSEEQDHVDFSKLYAFAPGNLIITEDEELSIGSDRYVITEAGEELLTTRLSVTKR